MNVCLLTNAYNTEFYKSDKTVSNTLLHKLKFLFVDQHKNSPKYG